MSTARPAARLGLVGVGRWGRVLLGNILDHPDTELTWVASRNPATRGLVGPHAGGVTIVEDWRTFADAGLDGLVIATPSPLHAEMARAAIEAGVPVFVEKPLCLDPAEARDIAATARARGVPVLVHHTQLFHRALPALIEAVERDGGAKWIATCGGQLGRLGGDIGALWDYGPHDVALALAVGGLDATITGVASEEARDDGLEVIRVSLTWPDAREGHLRFGNAIPHKERWIAVGTATATYLLDDLAPEPLARFEPRDHAGRPDGPGEPMPIEDGTPVQRALTSFVRLVRGDAADLGGGTALAVRVVEVLAAAESRLRGDLDRTS